MTLFFQTFPWPLSNIRRQCRITEYGKKDVRTTSKRPTDDLLGIVGKKNIDNSIDQWPLQDIEGQLVITSVIAALRVQSQPCAAASVRPM